MRVLVVQNFDGTGLGQVGTALREAGAEIDMVKAHRGEALPQRARHHDALIVLGGGQNALADDAHPYFPALLELAQDFAAAEKSVLGICLGSQLLARAFGGTNQIGGATEFGWCEVALDTAAFEDPLLGGLPAKFPIFQWHDDTFGLPPDAVRLAASPAVPNQAFRLGRAVYGLQFHFEADRPLVDRWTSEFADWIAVNQPHWPARHAAEAGRHGANADAAGLTIARAFVATIGGAKRATRPAA